MGGSRQADCDVAASNLPSISLIVHDPEALLLPPPPFLSLHFTSLLYLSPRLNILPLPPLRKSSPYRATAKRPWRIEETRRPFLQRGENTLIINHVSISPPLTGHATNLYGRGPGHPSIQTATPPTPVPAIPIPIALSTAAAAKAAPPPRCAQTGRGAPARAVQYHQDPWRGLLRKSEIGRASGFRAEGRFEDYLKEEVK